MDKTDKKVYEMAKAERGRLIHVKFRKLHYFGHVNFHTTPLNVV